MSQNEELRIGKNVKQMEKKKAYTSEILLGPSLGVSSTHDVLADGVINLLGWQWRRRAKSREVEGQKRE